jgi:single-stranded-DNA-specific exonuclease
MADREAEPPFDGVFEVVKQRGENHLKLLLRFSGKDRMVDAIVFHMDTELRQLRPQRLDISYRLDANEWQGRRRILLVVEGFLNVETG